jgi:hypothetical protein
VSANQAEARSGLVPIKDPPIPVRDTATACQRTERRNDAPAGSRLGGRPAVSSPPPGLCIRPRSQERSARLTRSFTSRLVTPEGRSGCSGGRLDRVGNSKEARSAGSVACRTRSRRWVIWDAGWIANGWMSISSIAVRSRRSWPRMSGRTGMCRRWRAPAGRPTLAVRRELPGLRFGATNGRAVFHARSATTGTCATATPAGRRACDGLPQVGRACCPQPARLTPSRILRASRAPSGVTPARDR